MSRQYSFLDRLRLLKKWMLLRKESVMLRFGKVRKGTLNAKIYSENYHDREDPVKKRGVICILDGSFFHGGPTDRMRGILTAYREAKRFNLPFYIHWRHPFMLEDYLIPATFDWRIADEEVSRSRKNAMPIVADDMSNRESLARLRLGMKCHRPQIHIYTNADSARGEYRELYKELFRPSPAVEKEVDRHLTVLGSDFSVYTFRFFGLLGDFVDCGPKALDEAAAVQLMEKVRKEFLKQLKEEDPNRRILVTADSVRFLQYIKDTDSRIYIVPGGVSNIDRSEGNPDGAWLKTFVDQQLIMHASKVVLMKTGEMYRSGFPRFAAEVGGGKFIEHEF